MSAKFSRCPICGQSLSNPSAEARVHQALKKRDSDSEAAFLQREAALKAELTRARATAKKDARRALQQEFAGRYHALQRRERERVAVAAEKAREEERRKSALVVERAHRQVTEYQRQLERLSSGERGDMGEAEIVAGLQRAFPGDVIERLTKRRGAADIRHEVRQQGRTCGVIIYEVKNTARWSGTAVAQARKSLSLLKASMVVLVSNAFPTGQKYLTFQKDVAIVHPTIAVKVMHVLRQIIVVGAGTGGSAAEREKKAGQLLAFIKSDDFRRSMRSVADAVADLQKLQTTERQTHARVWDSQAAFLRTIDESHTVIENRVAQILGGTSLTLVEGVDPGSVAAG